MPRKPRTTLVAQHPEIALGGLIALAALLVGFAHGFVSPVFEQWLIEVGAYFSFVLPIIVALKDNWTPRAALITAGAGLAWMLAFPALTHGHAEVVDGPMTLFSLIVSLVIQTLRKITQSEAPVDSPQTEPPGA